MYLLTMDPGYNTAVCLWNKTREIEKVFFFKIKKKEKSLSVVEKHQLMIKQFRTVLFEILETYKPKKIKFIIEGVGLWGSSSVSNAAALKGDSFNLAYLVGAYITVFDEFFRKSSIDIVSVQTWKGNLSTKILRKEVERFTKIKPKNEHIACAMGIGMNYYGVL